MLKTIFIICVISNFGYAAYHGHTWDSAVERSYFQGFALLMAWFGPCVIRFSNYLNNADKPAEKWEAPKGPIREPKRGDPDYIASIDA